MATMAGMPLPPNSYEDHSYKLIVSTVISFVIATVGVVGRLAARAICRKRLELNDYFIILAYIMKLGLTIESSFLIDYGVGRHIQILTLEQVTNYLKSIWPGSFIYAPSITFTKLSILSLYYVALPSRFIRVSVWVLAGITVAWGIAISLTGLLACLPIRKSWEPTIPGHCINQLQYYYSLQIPNIVTDFMILFLPFRDIYNLGLPRSKLLQVGGVMCIGLVTCAFDIIRLVVFIRIPKVLDITWVELAPAIWLDLETSVAILGACMLTMRPLLNPRRFWRAHRGEKSADSEGFDPTSEEIENRDTYAGCAIKGDIYGCERAASGSAEDASSHNNQTGVLTVTNGYAEHDDWTKK